VISYTTVCLHINPCAAKSKTVGCKWFHIKYLNKVNFGIYFRPTPQVWSLRQVVKQAFSLYFCFALSDPLSLIVNGRARQVGLYMMTVTIELDKRNHKDTQKQVKVKGQQFNDVSLEI